MIEQHKAPAGCSPTPQLLQHLLTELQEPFKSYMLQHLPGPQLAALRATCTLLRHFVDNAPASSIEHISHALLPKHSSQHSANSMDVQALLRQQRPVLNDLWACKLRGVRRIELADPVRVVNLAWSRPANRQLLAIFSRHGTAPEHELVHLQSIIDLDTLQPAMAGAALLLQEELDVVTIQWNEDGSHLVGLQVIFASVTSHAASFCIYTLQIDEQAGHQNNVQKTVSCVFLVIPAIHASQASVMLLSQVLC